MAGRGMGAATSGGGCVEKGAKNKTMKSTSKTTGPVFLADGGDVSPRKRMAMGMKDGGNAKKMNMGGYASEMGMKKGGSAKKMHKMPDGSMMLNSDMKKSPKKMKKGGSC
jgi:hypothetical protein